MKPQHGKRRERMLSSASSIARHISKIDIDRFDIDYVCKFVINRCRLQLEKNRRVDYVTPAIRHDYIKKVDRPKCGAWCKSRGRHCQAPPVYDHVNNRIRNGRCRIHGGLSTGPKTPEGRAKSLSKLRPFKRKSLATE